MRTPTVQFAIGIASVAVVTALLRVTLVANATIVALAYLVIVLFVAAGGTLWVALATSAVAMLCFNYFFLPPVGTLTVADPQNWVALAAFVAVSAVASQLAASARARAAEAEDRRVAAALARQHAELSSALLASLSHDLRTPLTAIQTAVSNIASGPDDQRQEQAAVALEQIGRLTHLFEGILDMARIESRSVRAERDWVTPADIIDAAIALTGTSLDGHRVSLDAASDTVVEADPRLTSSALAHVLENAAAYATPGTAIEVRGWADDDGLHLEVCDSGPGLDPAELGNLFEPFYRGRGAAALSAGTGMGLAITRGLLAAEQGRVWAENLPSGGARFSIVVPARRRPVAELQDV